jgi:predicted helicase
MILREMGYIPTGSPPRLSVYLTNSLEEGQPANQSLPFAQWLSNEVKEANTIKRDMPIMCVIGNPPYLGEGGVSEGWIGELMQAYKKEPGGVERLKERNPKWLNDLYVKFIRMSESLIEKNGEGVLAFITNHGYIDNPTFRGMRWHLMKTFDKIYVLDLHGNAKKKEVAPDGSNDVNVFDIQQGVSIIVGIKRKPATAAKSAPTPAKVLHAEYWGPRRSKYDRLQQASMSTILWQELDPDPKYQMFYPINRALLQSYDRGFDLSEFMPNNQIGFQSHRDEFAVAFEMAEISERFDRLRDSGLPNDRLREQFDLKDNRDWKLAEQRKRAQDFPDLSARIVPCDYRPFDRRYCMLDETMMDYPRWAIMKHSLPADCFALNFVRQTKNPSWQHAVVSKFPTPAVFVEIKDGSNFAPLYVTEDVDQTRRVNFDPALHRALIAKAIHPDHGEPTPEDIFDYIYAVLHCPAYRETYAEFLKIDFPRIPWPKTPEAFWTLVPQGRTLRRLHLMDPTAIGPTPYVFEGDGNNVVDQPEYRAGTIWINRTQGFTAVPPVSWDSTIGGYQPAQKWLKDRRGRTLDFADIQHYQRIIKILSETARLMDEVKMDLT